MLWPMLLDYSRNECKRHLRKLELEAYASIVSAFRAQGELSKDKKKMLHDLCTVLSISMERHKAEIRRAVNDEKLNTIADRMVGPNTGTDWAIEGRRLVPLMPRLVPQTTFTALANNLANIQAAKNATLPFPSSTGQVTDENAQEDPKSSTDPLSSPSSLPGTPVKGIPQAVSLTSPQGPGLRVSTPGFIAATPGSANNSNNVVLLPCGMAVQIKGSDAGTILIPEEDRESVSRKRKRSASLDSGGQLAAKVLVTSALPPGSSSSDSTSPIIMTSTPSPSPVRGIHMTNRGQQIHKTTIQGAQGGSKQVILVSGTSGSLPPSILQRCLSVPMTGKAVSTPVSSATYKSTATSTYSVASSPTATGVTTVSSVLSNPVVTASPTGTGNMLVYTTTSRPRSRGGGATIRPAFRPRAMVGANPGSVGQPGGPGAVQFPTPSSAAMKMQPNVQKPGTTYLRTPGVKILSQTVATSPARPRAAQSPLPSTTTKQTQAAQNVGTPRIVNVMSVNPSSRGGGTSLISTRLTTPSKVGQAIASRISCAGSGAKPNVIVVHKAQVWPHQQQQIAQGTAFVVTKSGQAFKDIMTYSQKQQQSLMKNSGGVSVVKPSLAGLSQTRTVQTASNTVTISTTTSMPSTCTPASSILELDPSQLDEEKNTLLADLIQAAGIAPDAAAAAAAAVVSVAMETFPPQMQTTTVTTTIASSAAPVTLVGSGSTTPCVAELVDAMDTEERQDSNSGSESQPGLQLGDLISPTSFTSKESPLASSSEVELTTVSTSTPSSPLVSATAKTTAAATKNVVETKERKEPEVELGSNSSVSVQEIDMPLDQLQGSQVLEIQAPDAAALLNSDGQLSKEVLEILHQAGFQLQNDQVTIDTSGLELSGSTLELQLESATEEDMEEKKKEDVAGGSSQLDPSTGLLYLPSPDEQQKGGKSDTLPSIVSVFSSDVGSQLDLETLHLVEDVLVQKSSSSPGMQTSLLKGNIQVEETVEQVCGMDCSPSSSDQTSQNFLTIPDLQNELTVIEVPISEANSVVVESLPTMSIDNVMVEVGSTELVVSGEEVQVDSTVMEGDVYGEL